MIDAENRDHAGGGVNEAFGGGGHGGFVDVERGGGDGAVEVGEEDERFFPGRGVAQGGFGGGELGDAVEGVLHDAAEAGDGVVGVGGGAFDERRQGELGLGGDGLELGELAAGFVEVAAEALQVLLHEFGQLAEADGTEQAEDAVEQAFAGAEEGAERCGPAHEHKVLRLHGEVQAGEICQFKMLL